MGTLDRNKEFQEMQQGQQRGRNQHLQLTQVLLSSPLLGQLNAGALQLVCRAQIQWEGRVVKQAHDSPGDRQAVWAAMARTEGGTAQSRTWIGLYFAFQPRHEGQCIRGGAREAHHDVGADAANLRRHAGALGVSSQGMHHLQQHDAGRP